MKMSTGLFLLLIVTLQACETGKSERELIQEENLRETHEVVPELPASVHNKISIKRHFSSADHQDEFVLILQGESYKDAELRFCILNHQHDTLFIRHAKGADFLEGADPDQIASEETQMEYIQHRFSTFFAETGFSHPPYTINDPIKTGISGDGELWKEIENDSSSWCFEFGLLKDGGVEVIAYSKKRDTILVYDATK